MDHAIGVQLLHNAGHLQRYRNLLEVWQVGFCPVSSP